MKNWFEHKPPTVLENIYISPVRNFTIQTDMKIKENMPDIIVKDFGQRSCFLIDITLSIDTNVSVKTYQNVSKYRNLEIEIREIKANNPHIT